MNALTAFDNKVQKHLVAYNHMCSAIAECRTIDECKDIVDKSVALAAYYAQIKDDEAVRNFREIKLRSWRRMAKLMGEVDVSNCITQASKVQVVRLAFTEVALKNISDSRIIELLKLSTISDDSFEHAMGYGLNSIESVFRHTPEHTDAVKKARKDHEKWCEENKDVLEAEEAKRKKIEEDRRADARAVLSKNSADTRRTANENRHMAELREAAEVAMGEVGITLERKDRANMKSVVFLIKDEIHEVMRQAAFDQRVTMQEILRRGLKMWLVAHDYDYPEG